MVGKFLAALLLTASASASVTLTIDVSSLSPAAGAYIRVDLQNCLTPTIVHTATAVPLTQNVFPNPTTKIATVTLLDNVTQIVCTVPSSQVGAATLLSYYTFTLVSGVTQTFIKSSELPPGTFNLANLANITTPPYQPGAAVGPQGLPGIVGGTWVNSDLYSGSDWCVRVQQADTAYLGKPAFITVNAASTVCSIPFNLHAHDLYITAPVTTSSSNILSGNNSVSCSGPSAVITATMGAGVHIFTLPMDAANVTISGCTFSGVAGSAHEIVGATGSPKNVSVLNNIATGEIGGITIGGASTSDPSAHILVQGNQFNLTANSCALNADVLIFGSYNDVRVEGNNFEGGCQWVETFTIDAATYPNLAQIKAAGGNGLVVSGNTGRNQGATAVFTSGAYKPLVVGNSVIGCQDACYDYEGTAYPLSESNHSENAQNAHYACQYSCYGMTVNGGVAISSGEAILFLNNNGAGAGAVGFQNDATIKGLKMVCPTTGCPAAFLSGNSNTTFSDVDIYDGTFSSNGFSPGFRIENSRIHLTHAVTNGLNILTGLGGSASYSVGNTITSTVSQSAGDACIAAADSNQNPPNDTVIVKDNTCTANFPNAAHFTNGTSNAGVNLFVTYRRNTMTSLSALGTGTVAGVGLSGGGNCLYASGNTALQIPHCDGTATFTSTAAASDIVTVPGLGNPATGVPSTCSLTATNASAAASIASTYISLKNTNSVTVTHPATAGMTFDINCTP